MCNSLLLRRTKFQLFIRDIWSICSLFIQFYKPHAHIYTSIHTYVYKLTPVAKLYLCPSIVRKLYHMPSQLYQLLALVIKQSPTPSPPPCTHNVRFWIGQAFKLGRLLGGDGGKSKRGKENGKRPTWMTPISHGYHVVEGRLLLAGDESSELDSDIDSVVVQREQIEDCELWFFGVFDYRIGDGVTKYMQSHLFDKKLKAASSTHSLLLSFAEIVIYT